MKLFTIENTIKDSNFNSITQNKEDFFNHCQDLSKQYKINDKVFIGVVQYFSSKIILASYCENCGEECILEYSKKFISELGYEIINQTINEIGLIDFTKKVKVAQREGIISCDMKMDEDNIRQCGQYLSHFQYLHEELINSSDRETYEQKAKEIMFNDTMLPEFERIYSNKNKTWYGNPVHYFIKNENYDKYTGAYSILLSALYDNNRLQHRRFFKYVQSSTNYVDESGLESMYESSFGGVVVIEFRDSDELEGYDEIYGEFEEPVDPIIKITNIVKKFSQDVLTVFIYSETSNDNEKKLFENLKGMCFVRLEEQTIKSINAKLYLEGLCKSKNTQPDSELFSNIKDNEVYKTELLDNIFTSWYGTKLRTTIYPEYQNMMVQNNVDKEEVPEEKECKKDAYKPGDAYAELMELAGLERPKEVINRVLNYFKAAKKFSNKGLSFDIPNLSMVFTGNPGTAKTTVARLYAQILKDNEILEQGQFIEVGRQDIVGKYVGWTAKTVKEKFRAAKGGCLFIDEAYSLVDKENGSYGEEAINVIVQEMENNRSDTVVIFAGYPDNMKKFIDKNPGLKSRIGYYVHFDDYSVSELCEISKLIAKNKGYILSEEALSKLQDLYSSIDYNPDFGNGRFARNCVENAIVKHGDSLLSIADDDITEEVCRTIVESDIEIPEIKEKPRKIIRRIGFSA